MHILFEGLCKLCRFSHLRNLLLRRHFALTLVPLNTEANFKATIKRIAQENREELEAQNRLHMVTKGANNAACEVEMIDRTT